MKVLVGYESRYGSTREIAERIAKTLSGYGLEVETTRAAGLESPAGYDAVVLGSGVYFGAWLSEAVAFVRNNAARLASLPVWLFSSGPVGPAKDSDGRDVRMAAVPKEIADFQQLIQPRGHQVFFGKLDRRKLRLIDRLVASLPAFPGEDGDFRDWAEIEAWATSIAAELGAREPAPLGA